MFPNGTYFEGGFNRNKPFGDGVWYFTNGNIVRGSYSQLYDAQGTNITNNWKTQHEQIDSSRYIES